VNNLFVNNPKTGGRFANERYKAWQTEALKAILSQPHRYHRHTEPVEVTYTFGRPDRRTRDLFNLEKAPSDFLVKQGILADDSLIHRGTVLWGDVRGVHIEINTLTTKGPTP
jgi:Holliday junction resolvase RusA-like endonuclease